VLRTSGDLQGTEDDLSSGARPVRCWEASMMVFENTGEAEGTTCPQCLRARAVAVFGDARKARAWLRRPNRALSDEPPLRMMQTDVGAVAVHRVLGRIEHGVFS
jgi:hypothetical protein